MNSPSLSSSRKMSRERPGFDGGTKRSESPIELRNGRKIELKDIDLSNLCLRDDDQQRQGMNSRGYQRAASCPPNALSVLESLYPSFEASDEECDSLYPSFRSLPEVNSAADAFKSASRRKSYHSLPSTTSTSHSNTSPFTQQQQHQQQEEQVASWKQQQIDNSNNKELVGATRMKGAFRSKSEILPKPPLPTWVERDMEYIERDFEEKKSGQNTPEGGSIDDEHYDDDDSYYSDNDLRYDEQPETRSKIEVAPGFYMELRGSQETMKYIQLGLSTNVTCVCCQVELRCIADAELVICPDCRVMSPVPQIHPNMIAKRMPRDMRSQSAGGVGLGLKLDVAI